VAGCVLLGLTAGLSSDAKAQNTPPAKYRLGVWIEPVSRWDCRGWVPLGLRITRVSPGSPAARAGVRVGNVLTSVNGSPVTSLPTLQRAVENSGGRASLVLHDGRQYTTRQVPSFVWTTAVARQAHRAPVYYDYAPPSGAGNARPQPRRVIHRPFYSNYGDAPSPEPFSTPPGYGDIIR
jgi:hypothetical protein